MKIGYARVSSTGQNLDRQISAFKEIGITKIFSEKISGRSIKNRPALNDLLDFIHEDDEIFVTELTRLGRNNRELSYVLAKIKVKGATINIMNFPHMDSITDPTLREFFITMLIAVLSYEAELELAEINERQLAGIKIAKQKGIYKGHKIVYSPNASNPKNRIIYSQVVKSLNDNISISQISRDTGLSRTTIHRIKSDLIDAEESKQRLHDLSATSIEKKGTEGKDEE